jgi:hypothetical protein
MNTTQNEQLYESFLLLKNEIKEKEKQLESLKKQISEVAPKNGNIYQNETSYLSLAFSPKVEFYTQDHFDYHDNKVTIEALKKEKAERIAEIEKQFDMIPVLEKQNKKIEEDFFAALKTHCIENDTCITKAFEGFLFEGLQVTSLNPSFVLSVQKIGKNTKVDSEDNSSSIHESKYFYKKKLKNLH